MVDCASGFASAFPSLPSLRPLTGLGSVTFVPAGFFPSFAEAAVADPGLDDFAGDVEAPLADAGAAAAFAEDGAVFFADEGAAAALLPAADGVRDFAVADILSREGSGGYWSERRVVLWGVSIVVVLWRVGDKKSWLWLCWLSWTRSRAPEPAGLRVFLRLGAKVEFLARTLRHSSSTFSHTTTTIRPHGGRCDGVGAGARPGGGVGQGAQRHPRAAR